MELLPQLLLNGIFRGSIYLMLAVGFTVLWGTTRIFDVGYGSFFVLSGYLLYLFFGLWSLPLMIAIPMVCIAVIIVATVYYTLLYKPMQRNGSTEFVIIAVSIGVLMLVENVMSFSFGNEAKFLSEGLGVIQWHGLSIKGLDLLTLATAVLVTGAMLWFLYNHRYGGLIRAVADNKEVAEVIGIDTSRINLFAYAIGALMTVPPAVLVAFGQGVYPQMGIDYLLMVVIAVVIGGVGNVPGAVIGAYLLAIVQNLAVWQIPSQWQASITFCLLILFLFIRPNGLFGTKSREGGV